MAIALTAYPLSQAFKAQLAGSQPKAVEYWLISELRQLSLWGMWRRLRTIRGAVIIPIEDEQSSALLPVLRLLAGISKASSRVVIRPDLTQQHCSRWQVLKDMAGFLACLITSRHQLRQVRRELSALAKQPQLPSQPLPKSDNALPGLFLNGNLWFGIKAGGSVGHIAGVANQLAKQLGPLRYAATDHNPQLEPSVDYVALAPPKQFALPYEINHYCFNQKIISQLASEQAGAQYIYQRLSLANYAGVVLAKKWQVPYIVEYNGSEAWIAKHWGKGLRYQALAEQTEQACLQHADWVVTISNALRDDLLTRGVEQQRIIVVPNGIDPEVFNPTRFDSAKRQAVRQEYGIPDDGLLFTFIGTFGIWHGVDVLAKAICLLHDNHAEWIQQNKIYFLLVGDGATMPEVHFYLRHGRFKPFVRLPGLVPQAKAPEILAASDVLLSPHKPNEDNSTFFGSPTKLFEYMAMAKPIIASPLGQIADILQPSFCPPDNNLAFPNPGNYCSMACRPGDVAHLAHCIQVMASHLDNAEKLGQNAHQLVLRHYTWQHHVAAILEKIQS